jgi:hypothetical protein
MATATELVSIASGAALCTVTGTVADLDGSAALAAVTETDSVLLALGAVNKPLEEIVPELALHTMEVAAVLEKLAVNCSVAPGEMTALVGKTVGSMLFEGELLEGVEVPAGVDADPEPQPAVTRMRPSKTNSTI